MKVLRQAADEVTSGGTVVTIGAYDGVHIGHLQVIEAVRRAAADRHLAAAVVTFDQHPATVVRPESAPPLLTDLDQKLELLDRAGLDYALVVHFDRERSEESAEDFVREVLVGRLDARVVIVGEGFHFGHKRQGDVALLTRMGEELGFEVRGLPLFPDRPGGQPVSSTRIRGLLAEGAVAEAAALLGRPHQVRGIVAHGDRRGRELGYPTANVSVAASIALPADGVYAGWYLRPGGPRLPAALSLGRRPTFYEDSDLSLLEAFLLDFDADLYGEPARVEFVARLRGQVRFGSAAELVEQMARDVGAARQVLAGA